MTETIPYDAIVVGGGPAGATAATVIAQAGRRVALLERNPETTFKIGESLMPATFWTFDRLGVVPALRASAFPRKFGVQFYTQTGRGTQPFYFTEFDPASSSQTWQVLRSDFDRILLDNARAHGVEVRMGTPVSEILFEGDRAVGVAAEIGATPVALRAPVVVDATGQSGMLARKFGLKAIDPALRHVAYYTHVEGAQRDPGIDEGSTLILHTEKKDTWFWYIPLPDDRVSVGVVGPVDLLVERYPGDPEAAFEGELARCPALVERVRGSRRVRPVTAVKDFSYICERIAGDGWVMAGDAFGFLDPIYSSGVLLALKGGEMAGDSVVAALAAGDPSAERLGRHREEFLAGMLAMRRVVYAFYDRGFSFGAFIRRHPELREQVIDLLMGNVWRRRLDGLMAALDAWTADADELAAVSATARG